MTKKTLPTLAEFLGWEDSVEYEFKGYIYKVDGDCLYYKTSTLGEWRKSNEFLRRFVFLRGAIKL